MPSHRTSVWIRAFFRLNLPLNVMYVVPNNTFSCDQFVSPFIEQSFKYKSVSMHTNDILLLTYKWPPEVPGGLLHKKPPRNLLDKHQLIKELLVNYPSGISTPKCQCCYSASTPVKDEIVFCEASQFPWRGGLCIACSEVSMGTWVERFMLSNVIDYFFSFRYFPFVLRVKYTWRRSHFWMLRQTDLNVLAKLAIRLSLCIIEYINTFISGINSSALHGFIM